MNERNALYLLSFLCALLRRYYVSNCLHVEPQLMGELVGIMTSPMYNEERDHELFRSRIISNPRFWIDTGISMSLAMFSAALFFRAFYMGTRVALVVRIEGQNRPQDPVAPAQQNVAAQVQENRAAFFQPSAGSSNAGTSNAASPANDHEQQTSSKKNR